MGSAPALPAWLPFANRVIATLQSVGIAFFSFHLLSIPGRRTGVLRTTVVSPFAVQGARYVVSFGRGDWVANARAAGWGILTRGRARTKVLLEEVVPPSSRPIVREFPRRVPAGVRFFTDTGLVAPPGGPDEFAAAADHLAVFRLRETM